MRPVFLAILMLTLPGCITASDPDSDVDFPVTLLATSSSMSHSGSGGVTAVPEENFTKPSECVLFRAGVAHDEDRCRVESGDAGRIASPWHISAAFKGSGHPLDDPKRWSEKTIEAYDDVGNVVAVWDGATDYHPQRAHAIE